mmetsp:Transcript_30898/g.74642  ORF Transcript_30898/g.74642 Transcript_30898/m.74642 type:complete len:93 (+) Transcript_30898:1385-1663(+)
MSHVSAQVQTMKKGYVLLTNNAMMHYTGIRLLAPSVLIAAINHHLLSYATEFYSSGTLRQIIRSQETIIFGNFFTLGTPESPSTDGIRFKEK